MPIVETRAITGGVDTHADTHVAAALDPVGGLLGVREFPVTAAGYTGLLGWLGEFGTACLVGIEGTGSYGAGLARHMSAAGVRVVEVDRSDRQDRRRQGKSDPLDAVSAARAAQSGRARGAPTSMIRPILASDMPSAVSPLIPAPDPFQDPGTRAAQPRHESHPHPGSASRLNHVAERNQPATRHSPELSPDSPSSPKVTRYPSSQSAWGGWLLPTMRSLFPVRACPPLRNGPSLSCPHPAAARPPFPEPSKIEGLNIIRALDRHRSIDTRPFASHPVSPTVTVSAPGSGYVRSAVVHAGVPGHPAADAGDCTQATKRQAPRRTVMITADCVPCLFRQMGARHRNSPGRRIRRVRSGRYHCSSGPCWPMVTREDPGETRGGPDRALSA